MSAITSSPSGEPCAAAEPSFMVPWAISVRTIIREGLSVSILASSSASDMATISSPFSTFITCQPIAEKRAATFSVKAISVEPSIVIRLLSYTAISLFSF